MKAISLCLWRRPEYTKRVLRSLELCDGIKDYKLFIAIDDGGPESVAKLARKFSACPTEVIVAPSHIGVNLNTKIANSAAFDAGADYVIHIEDDTPLAPDALRYFEWAGDRFRDSNIFTVTGWRAPNGWLPNALQPHIPEKENGLVSLVFWFDCWTWATWRDRWEQMLFGWPDHEPPCWDQHVNRVRGYRYEIAPHIARTENIGAKDGTHRGDFILSYRAGMPQFKAPAEYHLDSGTKTP